MPDSLFTRAIIVRAAGLWLGVRLMTALIGLPNGGLLLPTGGAVSVAILGVTVFLAGFELRRRDEFLLLGSLGHSPALLLGLSALPIPPLEVLFSTVVG